MVHKNYRLYFQTEEEDMHPATQNWLWRSYFRTFFFFEKNQIMKISRSTGRKFVTLRQRHPLGPRPLALVTIQRWALTYQRHRVLERGPSKEHNRLHRHRQDRLKKNQEILDG